MGRLRIVGGLFRGRRIPVVDLPGLRPTGERAREALFDILGSGVEGASVLDAYAGTGALGLEALSRGAGHVDFVESDPRAVRALTGALATLAVEARATAVACDVVAWLRSDRRGGPYDLVLADPPYAADTGARLLAAAAPVLAPGGRIVLERETGRPVAHVPVAVRHTRSARYGRCTFDFFVSASAGGSDPDRGTV